MKFLREEMDQINKYAVKQAKAAYEAGIDESDQINEYLTVYGKDTPLNGRQTLAYARIRKIDSDFSRAERQRKVLVALMDKLKECSATEIIAMGLSMIVGAQCGARMALAKGAAYVRPLFLIVTSVMIGKQVYTLIYG